MFMRHSPFKFLFVVFFGLLLLGGIRSSAFRSGYMQGVYAGQARVEQAAPAPSAPDGPAPAAPDGANRFESRGERGADRFDGGPYRGYDGYGHHHGFGFLGGFFKLLFMFFLFGIFLKFFRRGWGGRHGGGDGPRGPGGPRKGRWQRQWDMRSEKERKADEGFGPDAPMVDM